MEEMIYQETMNEEMETELVETDVESMVETDAEPEESRGNLAEKIIIGVLVAAGTAAVLGRKKIKKAIKNHNIKKLQKEGYIVIDPKTQPIEAEVSEPEEVDESDACEEVEE